MQCKKIPKAVPEVLKELNNAEDINIIFYYGLQVSFFFLIVLSALIAHKINISRYSRINDRFIDEKCNNEELEKIYEEVAATKSELEKSRQKLIEAHELAHLGDWEYNIVNKQIYWSDEIFRIYGLEPQAFEPSRSSTYHFIHPEDLENFKKSEMDILSGKLYEFEYRYVVNGKIGWIWIKARQVYDSKGELSSIRGYLQEITERKLFEQEIVKSKKEAEEASKLKSEYIANMSHELRTPLNVMLGALQLFDIYLKNDMESLREKMIKHVIPMKQNCLRLIRLVNNLIDTTKIDTGFMQIKLKNHNIVDIIEGITMSIIEFAKMKNIEVVFDCDSEEKLIACDVDMIERTMLNLISNAIKFTDNNGCIQINVIENKDKVMISVKDNGIGIPQDKLDVIFNRYKQVNASLSREQEGSGIGLSLSKSLVEMHGGRLYAKSILGNGSEFIIELPFITVNSDYSEQQSEIYIEKNHNLTERMNVEFSDIYN